MPYNKPAGYVAAQIAIRKDKLSRRHMAWIERNLEFVVDSTIMQAWDEDDDNVYLPRGILLDKTLPPLPRLSDQRVTRSAYLPDPKLKLRPYQKIACSKAIRKGSGVIVCPTGGGKTIMGLHIAGVLKQRTLIIVHTKDLIDQWVKSAGDMLGLAPEEIGIIGAGSWQEKDLTIATVQSLARYDFNKTDFPQQYGLVMLDEAHRCPADSFAKVMSAMPAMHMYGLTATPTRADNMHPLMHAIIGPIVARVKVAGLIESGKLHRPTVNMVSTGFDSDLGVSLAMAGSRYAKQKIYAKLVKKLTESKKRNELIVDLIVKHKDDSVLVLSERVAHLQTIYDMLMERDWEIKAEIVTGQLKSEDRQQIIQSMRDRQLNVLMATQLADEGLDIPVLNVLILTFPRKTVEKLQQQIGRIMRSASGKVGACVYDLVDDKIPVFERHAKNRRVHYTDNDMEIEGWSPKKRKYQR